MSTVTLEEKFTINDVLTDVTSVKLSDPTGTFGVKRNDTGAVVVADGTAMTKVSTGVYQHTFTEPALNLTYTYWIEWVYDGETYWDEKTCTGKMTEITAPITLTEAKAHLRVDHSSDDTYINGLMLSVTELCENLQRRIYVQRQKVHYLDEFPSDEIRPPYSPLVTVDSIKYYDTDGVLQTLDSGVYDVDTDKEPGRITLAYNQTWPATRPIANAVEITYTAGYADQANVPDDIKHMVKLLLGHFYENRESVSELNLRAVPQAFRTLLWAKRICR
jgi:uncharacterized phiE125 gp8 family phage protein